MKAIMVLGGVLACALASRNSIAVEPTCLSIVKQMATIVRRAPQSAAPLERLGTLLHNDAIISLFPPERLVGLLAHPEMPYYSKIIGEILQVLEPNASPADVTRVLTQILHNRVPELSIASRIDALQRKVPGSLLRALGENTLTEMLELLHGGNALNPTPESLIGQYLAETGAATLIRAFTREPNQHQSNNTGPQRLVVSVSETSFAAFQKYFMRPEMFSVHAHALLSNNGTLTSYMHPGVEFRLPSSGYPLPQVVLKTSEAQRLTLFLRLLATEIQRGHGYTIQNIAMHPWSIPGYFAQPGEYLNCTHWIGNIPVGDRRVESYTVPSNQNTPLIRQLQRFRSSDPLVTNVWRTPGHEQISDVIGIGALNGRGDMASPGYVVHTLLGETPVERVPLVFYVVEDHRQPIPAGFAYTVEGAN